MYFYSKSLGVLFKLFIAFSIALNYLMNNFVDGGDDDDDDHDDDADFSSVVQILSHVITDVICPPL